MRPARRRPLFAVREPVVFCRPDSVWANEYRTSYDDLRRHWNARAQLLPPYTTLDLYDFSYISVAAERYRGMDPVRLARRVDERMTEEQATPITAQEIALLERKLNVFHWVLRALFPRGFGFRLGESCLTYDPRRGRLLGDAGAGEGDFVVEVPPATMKEALHNNHISDLGITMFVRIRLRRPIDPRKAYGLFVLLQFDDYRHLTG